MAQLTHTEFRQAIELLAREIGLQRLRDKFVRLNALVTRRKVASADVLAEQLYTLSGALRRQVPTTYAFHHVWAEHLRGKLGEEGEQQMEKLADAVNACLADTDDVLPDKGEELDAAVTAYEQSLGGVVGSDFARMDMLLKAVPAVAAKLRAVPAQPVPAPPA